MNQKITSDSCAQIIVNTPIGFLPFSTILIVLWRLTSVVIIEWYKFLIIIYPTHLTMNSASTTIFHPLLVWQISHKIVSCFLLFYFFTKMDQYLLIHTYWDLLVIVLKLLAIKLWSLRKSPLRYRVYQNFANGRFSSDLPFLTSSVKMATQGDMKKECWPEGK